jgi:hypothetical protein
MKMDELVPGKEYIFVPQTPAEASVMRLHGSTFTFERQGVLFENMAMGKIRGVGIAVYPSELIDPEEDDG